MYIFTLIFHYISLFVDDVDAATLHIHDYFYEYIWKYDLTSWSSLRPWRAPANHHGVFVKGVRKGVRKREFVKVSVKVIVKVFDCA